MNEQLEAKSRHPLFLIALIGTVLFLVPPLVVYPISAGATETLRLSCSAQVYEAFRGRYLEDFSKETGIEVNVDVVSSWEAVNRLSSGASDLAATAEALHPRFKDQGMLEFPFCRDALVVITHAQNPVRNLTGGQLRSLFSGSTSNWKQLGGPDLDVRVIIPDKQTAAYKTFDRLVMRETDVAYSLLTARSTVAASVTRRFKGGISFVNQGALRGKPGAARIVLIDGLGPDDFKYPYYEVFSLVTRGNPRGSVKRFVDHAFSEEARRIFVARGMKPIAE